MDKIKGDILCLIMKYLDGCNIVFIWMCGNKMVYILLSSVGMVTEMSMLIDKQYNIYFNKSLVLLLLLLIFLYFSVKIKKKGELHLI